MSIFREIAEFIRQLFSWWFVVAPWEQAVRVRLGKHLKVLGAGIHMRIPFIDRVYLKTTRLRYTDCPVQTITTADGKTVTISGTVGYTITDIRLLYETLHHASDAVMNMAMAEAAKEIMGRTLSECLPSEIEQCVTDNIALDKYGLGNAVFRMIDFGAVRTLRIIQAQKYPYGSQNLDTCDEMVPRGPR